MARIDMFMNELALFYSPLVAAAQDKESLDSFCQVFGFDVDDASLTLLFDDIQDVIANGSSSFNDLENSNNPQIVDIVSLTSNVLEAIEVLAESSFLQSVLGSDDDIVLEVFNFLSYQYLSTRVYLAESVLTALGVITHELIETTDPGGRQVDFVRVEFQWSRLDDLVQDNGKWAYDVYGWAGNPNNGDDKHFDFVKAIRNSIRVIHASELSLIYLREIPDADEIDFFLKNAGNEQIVEAILPFYQSGLNGFNEVNSQLVFSNEAGLKLVPFGDMTKPEKLGLAVAPYAKGDVPSKQQLSDRLTLDISASAQAAGGVYLTITPDGIDVVGGGAASAEFDFSMAYENPDQSPIMLVGDAQSTRIQTDAILATIGGNMDGDLYLAGGLNNLKVVIDLRDDGFLNALLSSPIDIDAGNIVMGWRTGRGVYFEGGTSLSIRIPLNRDFGPVSVYELAIVLDWEDGFTARVMITGSAELGPFYAYAENLGVSLDVISAPDGSGLLGRYDIQFGFRSPTGYALELDGSVVEGGGFLSVHEQEYRGALSLAFQDFGFSAFGILNTQLPNGQDGFSFVASIFGEFNVSLGYGFFLLGLGGVIGINRTINTDEMRLALYEGRLDNVLFPEDPIANAQTILDVMATTMPARSGQHILGPVAKLGWGVPILIEIKLGIILKFGMDTDVYLLGGVALNLPTKDSALVSLNLAFFGEIDFSARTINFDGTLGANSRILSFPVSGDMAVRTGWASRLEHIASFGGLHPQFPRPANFPDLRRMSIDFGTNNPRVTISSYVAVTLSSLQFGARADLYARGPKIPFLGRVAAEGEVYCNALIYFNPFAFDVEVGGSLALLVDGDVQAALHFALRLRGPNTFRINGRVWITVLGIDVDFGIKHQWGAEQSLPVESVDPVEVLRSAYLLNKLG